MLGLQLSIVLFNSAVFFRRGLKCLKKGYSLSPTHDEICIAYVDELMVQNKNDQALDILIQTTKLAASGR